MYKKFSFVAFLILLTISIYFSGFFKETVIKGKVISNSRLKAVVEKAMANSQGRYAIAVKNFKTGETYYSKEHEVFESGSLYKLWVMASAFQKLKEGELKEGDLLSEDVRTLNNRFGIDPESVEFTEGSITLTVSQALKQMVTISHNYAALLLTQTIKESTVVDFLKSYGFKESSFQSPPKTTASDMALFLEKLYRGEIIDSEFSQRMVELLKGQRLDNGLTKYLPDQGLVANEQSSEQQFTIVVHKTGDIGWFKHDVGLVYAPKGDYLMAVLSESDYPAGAQEKIALLSKAVFDYFN